MKIKIDKRVIKELKELYPLIPIEKVIHDTLIAKIEATKVADRVLTAIENAEKLPEYIDEEDIETFVKKDLEYEEEIFCKN